MLPWHVWQRTPLSSHFYKFIHLSTLSCARSLTANTLNQGQYELCQTFPRDARQCLFTCWLSPLYPTFPRANPWPSERTPFSLTTFRHCSNLFQERTHCPFLALARTHAFASLTGYFLWLFLVRMFSSFEIGASLQLMHQSMHISIYCTIKKFTTNGVHRKTTSRKAKVRWA
jgi:hypothetical protein